MRTHLYSSKKLPIRSPKYSTHTRYMIGASLNEPHTSVTSLHTCVCMIALILLGPTTSDSYFVRFASALIKKEFEDRSRRRETLYSLLPRWRQQGQRLLVNLPIQCLEICHAICLCCLTHSSCHWTRISSSYSDGGYRKHMPIKMAFICPCHLHMTCTVHILHVHSLRLALQCHAFI